MGTPEGYASNLPVSMSINLYEVSVDVADPYRESLLRRDKLRETDPPLPPGFRMTHQDSTSAILAAEAR
jgi:hypothetical protein